ncbi:hypothetical protein DFH09DRAFT_1370055 [Mycena vulgaris]|nr:hypothetical protein DFH09DRAFT_1370055 [Mycena vulgaris]
MHHALQIAEVVDMICAQVASPDGLLLREHGRDLARVARTSTIFLNSALDVLWRHQGTLLNLLRTMPNDLWNISGTRIDGEEEEGDDFDDPMIDLHISLRRAVTLSDWDRFLFYSSRVKSFSDDDQGSIQTAEVFETLSSWFPVGHLFPNLQKLNWWITAESFNHFHLLLSPGITDLQITIEHDAHLSILSTMVATCRDLTTFHLGTPRVSSAAAIAPISNFVCTLRHVESLVVVGLDQAALSHIAQLPNLRYLWLMSSGKAIPSLQPPSGSLHFPSLKTLECETIEDAPAFLETLGRCLTELILISRAWRVTPTKSTIQRFYSALATHCSHSSFQKLTVPRGPFLPPISPDQLEMYSVGGEILEPLFGFRNLVMVSLSHRVGVDLNDELVADMARAWPRIEVLHLPPDDDYRISLRLTLAGVSSFATHCPLLRELSIAFDSTIIPDIKINGRKRVSQSNLAKLHVAYSPVGKPRRVAKFFHAIFPCLAAIGTSYGKSLDVAADAQARKGWEKVQQVLCEL